MKACILAIGSEMLTPFRVDTNSLFITERLNAIGYDVRLKAVVADDVDELALVVRAAMEWADVLVVTGGLGPTEDDITRDAVARVLDVPLEVDEAIVERIRDRFARRGLTMPEINRRQAMVPRGAVVLDNPNGTAPGLWIERGRTALLLLPGPPREMKPMFANHVMPKLVDRAGSVKVVRRMLRVAGLGESAVDEKIAPIYTQYENPQTTILFNQSEIEIHLTARGRTEAEAGSLLDRLSEQLEERLGNAVFSFAGEKMEEVVGLKLAVGGYSLAVAESCTGGLIAQRLTDVAGSSKYFIEGVVAYSNDAKTRTLGVEPVLLLEHGAVSAPVAEAMAEGVRQRARTDFGLSVTGIAGPGGGSEEKPVGLVYIALADDAHIEHRRMIIPGDRQLIRWRASQAALDLLRRRLI